jgi:hypothetical protein
VVSPTQAGLYLRTDAAGPVVLCTNNVARVTVDSEGVTTFSGNTNTVGDILSDGGNSLKITSSELTFSTVDVPVAFDSASSQVTTSSETSLTWSHTVASNSNRLLVVGVSLRHSVGTEVVSSVTFNGVPLTFLSEATRSSARSELWYLLDPPATTADVVVTLSSADRAIAGAASYYNVSQTFAFRPTASNTGSGLIASVPVSCRLGDMVFSTISRNNSGGSLTVGAGQNSRWSRVTAAGGDSSGSRQRGGGSDSDGIDGVVTMEYTWSDASRFYSMLAVAIKPTTAPIISATDSGVAVSESLVVNSTSGVFLPPRMSTSQKDAIVSPTAGSVVYDTTLNKLCVFTGSSWETITSS